MKVKANKTITIDAIILQSALDKGLNINAVCETALALASDTTKEQSLQVLSDMLKEESEFNKNKQVLRRLYSNRGKGIIADGKFAIAIRKFCSAYKIDITEGMLIAEGKKEKVAPKEKGSGI
jgi:post-segregation antitoxin (ccd killing protein)